jgi:hypothetical protein
VSRLPALILRRDRPFAGAARVGSAVAVPRPRAATDRPRSAPVIHRGADALNLLEIAPPSPGFAPGSLMLGFAVGAMVATRRRSH